MIWEISLLEHKLTSNSSKQGMYLNQLYLLKVQIIPLIARMVISTRCVVKPAIDLKPHVSLIRFVEVYILHTEALLTFFTFKILEIAKNIVLKSEIMRYRHCGPSTTILAILIERAGSMMLTHTLSFILMHYK